MVSLSSGRALVRTLNSAKSQFNYVSKNLLEIQSQAPSCLGGEGGDSFNDSIEKRKKQVEKIYSLTVQIIGKVNSAMESIKEREED